MLRPLDFRSLVISHDEFTAVGISRRIKNYSKLEEKSETDNHEEEEDFCAELMISKHPLQKGHILDRMNFINGALSLEQRISVVPSCIDLLLLNTPEEEFQYLLADRGGRISLYSRGLFLKTLDNFPQMGSSRPGSIFYFRVFHQIGQKRIIWIGKEAKLVQFDLMTGETSIFKMRECLQETNWEIEFILTHAKSERMLVGNTLGEIVMLDANFSILSRKNLKSPGTLISNGHWPTDPSLPLLLFPFAPGPLKNSILAIDSYTSQPRWSLDCRHKGQPIHHTHWKRNYLIVSSLYYTRGTMLSIEVYEVSASSAKFIDLVILPPDIALMPSCTLYHDQLLLFAKNSTYSLKLDLRKT